MTPPGGGGFPGGFGLQYLMPFTPPEPLNINDQSVTCLLKNCSCEACPFPPALAVVVSPDPKLMIKSLEFSISQKFREIRRISCVNCRWIRARFCLRSAIVHSARGGAVLPYNQHVAIWQANLSIRTLLQICIAHAVWLRVKVVDVEIPNGRADAAAISVAVKTFQVEIGRNPRRWRWGQGATAGKLSVQARLIVAKIRCPIRALRRLSLAGLHLHLQLLAGRHGL